MHFILNLNYKKLLKVKKSSRKKNFRINTYEIMKKISY